MNEGYTFPYKQIIESLVEIIDSYSNIFMKHTELQEIAEDSKAVVKKVNETLQALEKKEIKRSLVQ